VLSLTAFFFHNIFAVQDESSFPNFERPYGNVGSLTFFWVHDTCSSLETFLGSVSFWFPLHYPRRFVAGELVDVGEESVWGAEYYACRH
jgi:hypothetical protein